MNLTRNGLIVLVSVIFVAGAGTAYAAIVLPTITFAGNTQTTGNADIDGDLNVDGTISGAIAGSEIIGTSKLIFGTCSELIPFEIPIPSAAEFGYSLICDEPNVTTSDQVVGTFRGINGCNEHQRTLINQNGEISFDFKNICSFALPANTVTLTVDYIVFKT